MSWKPAHHHNNIASESEPKKYQVKLLTQRFSHLNSAEAQVGFNLYLRKMGVVPITPMTRAQRILSFSAKKHMLWRL